MNTKFCYYYKDQFASSLAFNWKLEIILFCERKKSIETAVLALQIQV